MSFFWVGHFEFFFRKKKNFFCFIPMKISPTLYGRMDGSKFWCFPWFPENSLLCVILCYTVYNIFWIIGFIATKNWVGQWPNDPRFHRPSWSHCSTLNRPASSALWPKFPNCSKIMMSLMILNKWKYDSISQ